MVIRLQPTANISHQKRLFIVRSVHARVAGCVRGDSNLDDDQFGAEAGSQPRINSGFIGARTHHTAQARPEHLERGAPEKGAHVRWRRSLAARQLARVGFTDSLVRRIKKKCSLEVQF